MVVLVCWGKFSYCGPQLVPPDIFFEAEEPKVELPNLTGIYHFFCNDPHLSLLIDIKKSTETKFEGNAYLHGEPDTTHSVVIEIVKDKILLQVWDNLGPVGGVLEKYEKESDSSLLFVDQQNQANMVLQKLADNTCYLADDVESCQINSLKVFYKDLELCCFNNPDEDFIVDDKDVGWSADVINAGYKISMFCDALIISFYDETFKTWSDWVGFIDRQSDPTKVVGDYYGLRELTSYRMQHIMDIINNLGL
jgi:hypothetical protein